MPSTKMSDIASDLVSNWTAKPANTARSVLVTIFGDTVLPVATDVWLAQLFELTDSFGFSRRLVRTSMFRLAAEGWFTTERVGRQSRYTLTPLAIEESERAEKRIYNSAVPDWSGRWTAAFLDTPTLANETRAQLAQHLRWHGFITLSPTILASPTSSLESARDHCNLIEPGVELPFATFEFDHLEAVVADGFFAKALAIDDLGKSYDEFVEQFEPLSPNTSKLTSVEAFVIRTMLVHDLRRIRLRGPDVPTELLPSEWIGHHADAVASGLYYDLTSSAADALSTILDTTYPTRFPARFPDAQSAQL